jgi:hypothetical protein
MHCQPQHHCTLPRYDNMCQSPRVRARDLAGAAAGVCGRPRGVAPVLFSQFAQWSGFGASSCKEYARACIFTAQAVAMAIESAAAVVAGFLGTLLGAPPAGSAPAASMHSAAPAPPAALNRRAHRDKWLKLSADPLHPLQPLRDMYYRTCHAALGAAGTDPAFLRHGDRECPSPVGVRDAAFGGANTAGARQVIVRDAMHT